MIANIIVWKLSLILELPTITNKLEIYSDGNKQYIAALLEHYKKECLIYGQLIKVIRGKKLADKYKRKIFGNPDYSQIETVNIESYNGILRERIGRLVRRTKCFSKKRSMLENHLDIFQAYNNTMKEYEDGTPCMNEGLLERKWRWMDIFMYR